MAGNVLDTPFGDEPLADVFLQAAPLVSTLTQIRFAPLTALSVGDEAANRFANRLSKSFEIFEANRETRVTFTPAGVLQSEGDGRLWQLRTTDGAWRINFAASFLSVDTSMYPGREHFVAKVADIWTAFGEEIAKPTTNRVGFRYINRIAEPGLLHQVPAMVRSEVMGVTNVAFPVPANGTGILHSMSDNLFRLRSDNMAERTLQVRIGLLPPGVVHDPTIQPINGTSWVLDIDSAATFSGFGSSTVDVPELVRELATSGYRFFRWSVNDKFLQTFGGEV